MGLSRGYAFVRFNAREEAEEAIKCMNGGWIDSKQCSVKFLNDASGKAAGLKGSGSAIEVTISTPLNTELNSVLYYAFRMLLSPKSSLDFS